MLYGKSLSGYIFVKYQYNMYYNQYTWP